jgi:hypothetical protein
MQKPSRVFNFWAPYIFELPDNPYSQTTPPGLCFAWHALMTIKRALFSRPLRGFRQVSLSSLDRKILGILSSMFGFRVFN